MTRSSRTVAVSAGYLPGWPFERPLAVLGNREVIAFFINPTEKDQRG